MRSLRIVPGILVQHVALTGSTGCAVEFLLAGVATHAGSFRGRRRTCLRRCGYPLAMLKKGAALGHGPSDLLVDHFEGPPVRSTDTAHIGDGGRLQHDVAARVLR